MSEPRVTAGCPFCSPIESEVLVAEEDLVRAIVSRAPINDYHVMIVPRVHVERLPDLPLHVAAAAMHMAQRVGAAIARASGADGITYITEDDVTGQGYNLVSHWKLHVIARFRGDKVRLEWSRGEDPGLARRGAIALGVRRAMVAPDTPPAAIGRIDDVAATSIPGGGEFAQFPSPLRDLVLAELAAGNTIVELGHGFPSAPRGAWILLAQPVSTQARTSTPDLAFHARNNARYSGEFTTAERHFFVLEAPLPPEPPPDMNAIRAALDARNAAADADMDRWR